MWTPDTIIIVFPICFHLWNKLAWILGWYCRNKWWHKSWCGQKECKRL